MLLRKFSIIAVSSLLLLAPSATVYGANFSSGETNQVQHYQKEYASLKKYTYNINNLYEVKPHLSKPFSAGKLKKQYISEQLDYINYYRSLFGLPAITTTAMANTNAQKTAAVMAAIDANPFINQHGLPSDTKPAYISKSLWKLAQDTSETSNLNFNVTDQSAGDVITDLLTDHYNLTGSDTGHRAWLLSTRLSSTGIGAAYGNNGYRYSVQKVLNIDDLFRTASQEAVPYPSSALFPIELTKGKNIAWSLYLSNKNYNSIPKVTITDKDTGKSYKARNVKNYSSAGYGNFKTVITYLPGKTPIVSGHQYQVKIGKLYKYTFKLYKLDASTNVEQDQSDKAPVQKGSVQQDTKLKSASSNINAKLWAIFNPNPQWKSSNNFFDILKKGQFKPNFFLQKILRTIS